MRIYAAVFKFWKTTVIQRLFLPVSKQWNDSAKARSPIMSKVVKFSQRTRSTLPLIWGEVICCLRRLTLEVLALKESKSGSQDLGS